MSFVRDLGASIETYVTCDNHEIIAVCTPRERTELHEGAEVGVLIKPEDCVVLKT